MFRKLTVRIRQVLTGQRVRREVSANLRRVMGQLDRAAAARTLALA